MGICTGFGTLPVIISNQLSSLASQLLRESSEKSTSFILKRCVKLHLRSID